MESCSCTLVVAASRNETINICFVMPLLKANTPAVSLIKEFSAKA